MRLKYTSTYKKALILVFASSCFFLTLVVSLYIYTVQQELKVYENSKTRFSNEILTLLDLKSEQRYNISIDYTYWDEFIDYIYNEKSPEANYWYQINIGSALETFDVDYFGTYDIDENFIVENISEKINGTQIFSKSILPHILKERLIKFYYTIPEGVLEVYGATIHPYSDIKKTKTKPEGFFIVAKLLDNEYFTELENISGSTIELVDSNFVYIPSRKVVSQKIQLKDINNNNITNLIFTRPFTLNFKTSKNILLIIISAFLINLIIFIIYYRKILYIPLTLITKTLEKSDKSAIAELKKSSGEFGYIGNLFLENVKQKENLKIALEKANESDRLKSAFLTNLSHEIRTPMNAIIGFSDLLNNNSLSNDKKSEYVKIIMKSGYSLLAIIDDLIEIAIIDSKQNKPNYTSFKLDETILEVIKTVEITIPSNKLIKITEPKNPTNNVIISDVTKLKQIFTNLLTNAIKFTNKGTISFSYDINYQNNIITFNIKDEGIGINYEDQKYIFDRFHRSQSDRNIRLRGLGLGLAICKAYVEMLGGTIWIESKKDVGSTFSFTTPLKLDLNYKKEKENNISSFKKIDKENTRVLVAEDDDSNFMLIDIILSDRNYSIIRAKDGIEAVNICKTTDNLKFVLMDIKMPKLDGIKAQQQIKEFKPNLPIIAYTAYTSKSLKNEIHDSGFIDCITKPIDKVKFFNLLDSLETDLINKTPHTK